MDKMPPVCILDYVMPNIIATGQVQTHTKLGVFHQL